MASRQIPTVKVQLGNGELNLKATNEAFAELEDIFQKPFQDIGAEIANMRIRHVCAVAATLARAAGAENVKTDAVLKMTTNVEDIGVLRNALLESFFAALPPKKEGDEPAPQQGEASAASAPERPS